MHVKYAAQVFVAIVTKKMVERLVAIVPLVITHKIENLFSPSLLIFAHYLTVFLSS